MPFGTVRVIRNIVLTSAVVAIPLVLVQPLSAMAASASPRAAVPAPAPPSALKTQIIEFTPAANPPPPCKPKADGDYVHVSSTPPATASGHGWWKKGNCIESKARVIVQLQEYYSDHKWRDKGKPGSAVISPGTGGSANRVTARQECTGGTPLIGWRSVVEVIVQNQLGVAVEITATRNIHCRVY
jgi:hypothetical protein